MDMFSETAMMKLQTTKDRPAYKMYQELGFIDMLTVNEMVYTVHMLGKLIISNQSQKAGKIF